MIQASIRLLAPVLATGFFVAGCTSQPSKMEKSGDGSTVSSISESANKEVENRALARWNLLIARDGAKAYDFLSPGFKATKSRNDYANEMNNRPVHWEKVLPYSQQCDKPNVCVISLQVDSDVKMQGVSKAVSTVGFVTETWIKSKGKWYFLPNSKQSAGSE